MKIKKGTKERKGKKNNYNKRMQIVVEIFYINQ